MAVLRIGNHDYFENYVGIITYLGNGGNENIEGGELGISEARGIKETVIEMRLKRNLFKRKMEEGIMRKLKKTLAVVLASTLALTLSACGGGCKSAEPAA